MQPIYFFASHREENKRQANMNTSKKGQGRVTFPRRLHILLSKSPSFGFEDIISWNYEGTKFIIKNENLFVRRILRTIFNQSSFSSFQRQLNAYGFKREKGPKISNKNCLVFSHKLFCRNDPTTIKDITRNYPNSKRSKNEQIFVPDNAANTSRFDPTDNAKKLPLSSFQEIQFKPIYNIPISKSSKPEHEMSPLTLKSQIIPKTSGDTPDCAEKIPSLNSRALIDDDILDCLAETVCQDIDDESIDILWDSEDFIWDPSAEELK